jgi:hypothetical protein
MPTDSSAAASRHETGEFPAIVLPHEAGLTPQRLRELFTAEDAYSRRPAHGARGRAHDDA